MPTQKSSPDVVATASQPFPLRRPVRAAVLASAVYATSLAVWLVLPWERGTQSAEGVVMTLGVDLTRIVVAVAFLSTWRLWRRSGLLTAPGWKRVVPALPLLLLPALPAFFGPGLVDRPGWKVALAAFGVATVALGEEGMFRGVILPVLLVSGVRPAVVGSAALFGLMHVVGLLDGGHPITIAAQVIMAFGLGIGFGAVALVTGTIWPLVVIHFLLDFANAIQAAVPGEDTGVAMADLLVNGGINIALGVLTAVYGLWLLRRRTA